MSVPPSSILLMFDLSYFTGSVSYIFFAKLIGGEMNGPKRPSPNLLPDDILVDPVLSRAVILARGILGAGVQRFLMSATSAPDFCHKRHSGITTNLHRTPRSDISLPMPLGAVKRSRWTKDDHPICQPSCLDRILNVVESTESGNHGRLTRISSPAEDRPSRLESRTRAPQRHQSMGPHGHPWKKICRGEVSGEVWGRGEVRWGE